MNEKFGERFVEAWKAWRPDLYDLSDWAEFLNISYDDANNYKRGRAKPRGKVAQLAKIYEPLRAYGCDPVALANYVFFGEIEMPRPKQGGPDLEPEPPTPRGRITKLAEAVSAIAETNAARGIARDLLKAARSGDAKTVSTCAESLRPLAKAEPARALVKRLAREAQSSGLGVSSGVYLLFHPQEHSKRVG